MPLLLPAGSRLVVATHNPGKAVEIAALLDARLRHGGGRRARAGGA